MTRKKEYENKKKLSIWKKKTIAELTEDKAIDVQEEANKRYDVKSGKTRPFTLLECVVADMMDPYQLSVYYWIKSVIAMRIDGKIDLTSRQIARASGMSHRQVSKCIKWMAENKIITIEKEKKKEAMHDSYLLTLRDEELTAKLDPTLTYCKLRPRKWAQKHDN